MRRPPAPPPPPDDVLPAEERRWAHHGERCSCGRPAAYVTRLTDGREIPSCGLSLAQINRERLQPCPRRGGRIR